MRRVPYLIAVLVALAGFALPPDPVRAAYVQRDAVNGDLPPVADWWGNLDEAGWTYVASTSYTLTRIETQFGAAPGKPPDNRTMTIKVYDEPSPGGMLLASTSFSYSTSNTFLGGDLNTPVSISAGEDYFISLTNFAQAGLNVSEAAGTNLDHCWLVSGAWFCIPASIDSPINRPILRFFETITDAGLVENKPNPRPGPDMVPIPETAVMGTFTDWASLFWKPDPSAGTSHQMGPGQSLWVFGVDQSGQFFKVLLSGKFYWVPVWIMRPTDGGVWNARPLPGEVVTQ